MVVWWWIGLPASEDGCLYTFRVPKSGGWAALHMTTDRMPVADEDLHVSAPYWAQCTPVKPCTEHAVVGGITLPGGQGEEYSLAILESMHGFVISHITRRADRQ